MSNKNREFDVVIAGGAMVGATLALALHRKTSLKIAVVEAFDIESAGHPGFDSRAIALSLGSVELLKQYDLWSDIQPVATPINHINVSDRSHFGMTDIERSDAFNHELGQVVELSDVGRVLTHKISLSENISLFCPSKVDKIERENNQVNLQLDDGITLSAKLLVAADGVASECCEQLGLTQTERAFNQTAIITNIETKQLHQNRAFERFTAQGPLALLPMSDNRYSVVWCVENECVEPLLAFNDKNFIAQLQSEFGWRAGKIIKAGSRSSYPLSIYQRSQTVSHRFAVVGNAAQTLHPIAGQGFNLGLRDVALLVEKLSECQNDVGVIQPLLEYQAERSSDKSNTLLLTESLVRIFSNNYFPTTIGRNIGLAVMDTVPALKAPLLQHTLGLIEKSR